MSVRETGTVLAGAENPSVTLGLIQDVSFGDADEVLVLDRLTPQLIAFDTAGSAVASTGAEGQGPGEWLWPSSIDVDDAGSIRILSQGLSRIDRYTLGSGDLELRDEVQIPFLPRDLCTLGDRLFVLGLHQGATVHEIGAKGEILSSFGPPQERPPALLGEWSSVTAEWTADGFLYCDADAGVVVHATYALPTVSAYRPDGVVAWRSTIDGWSQRRWQRLPSGMVTSAPDSETGVKSGIFGLVPLGDRRVLVQYRELAPTDLDTGRVPVVGLVFDLDSGRYCRLAESLPQLLAVKGRSVAWEEDSLVPGVVLGELSGDPCSP